MMTKFRESFRFAALATLAAAMVAARPSPSSSCRADEPALSPALKAVQGSWTTRDDVEAKAKWVIKGDALKVNVNGTDYAGKITLDADAKPHATLNFEVKEGPGEDAGKTAKGVYKLEGDKLIVNIGVPGKDRPIDFNPYGDEIYLFELTRQKATKE